MKKMSFCLILLVFLTFSVFLAGCSEEETRILPPVRECITSESEDAWISPYYEEFPRDVFLASDAVAWVRVGNWLSESDTGFTYYDAEVLEFYKGKGFSDFVLIQSGWSENTMKELPLFVYGDELIVFLSKADPKAYTESHGDRFEYPYDEKYENAYYITSLKAVLYRADHGGKTYFVDRFGRDFIFTPKGDVPGIGKIYGEMKNKDPYVWGDGIDNFYRIPKAYPADEMQEGFSRYRFKNEQRG